MATATTSNTAPTAAVGQGADDNYSATGLASEPGTGDAQVSGDATDSQTPSQSEAAFSAAYDSRSSDPLRAERRKTNQLEKEIRTLKQQLNRFSEINPEEYSRLQDAERQKQILEQQVELRERQMEEASAKKVAAVAAERDDAKQQILQLRKERLLERAFSEAEGRTGGDGRGTFSTSSKGSWAPASGLATATTARTCSNPSTPRASRCSVMTAGQ